MAFPSVTSATAYFLGFYASGVLPSHGPYDRRNGFPIRCLAYQFIYSDGAKGLDRVSCDQGDALKIEPSAVILIRVSLVYDLKKLYLNPASSFIISSGLGKLSQRFSESLVYVFQKRKLLFCTLPLLLSIKSLYVFKKRKVIHERDLSLF